MNSATHIMVTPVLFSGLICAIVAAAFTDVRSSRIPNWLTFSLAGFGVGVHSFSDGWSGFWFSVEGLILGIICLLVFYANGGMGAGDVKFLGGIGAVVGSPAVLQVFLLTALLGGVYAVAMMMYMGGGQYAWNRVITFFTTLLVMRRVPRAQIASGGEPKLRYALVIGLGTLLAQTFTWYDLF